jgi:chaperonin cofactor prefoldin
MTNSLTLQERIDALTEEKAKTNQEVMQLHAEVDNLVNETKALVEKDNIITMREICNTLEDCICREILGSDAKDNLVYRFKYIENKDRIDSVLKQKNFERGFFPRLKNVGNVIVHEQRSILEAELERTVEGIIGSTSADAFMKLLQKYNMIQAGVVDAFKSPFPGRCLASL